jgi:cell fate (sporulation/competence/biofilm development) regulator YlbF (YheA/YmcA/DUF963 family)
MWWRFMVDQRSNLAQAIARLPLREGVNVQQSAFALQMFCYFSRVNELPRMQRSRQKNGMAKELREFMKRATRLSQHIGAMHAETQAAISTQGKHVEAVHEDLKRLIVGAEAALQNAPETEAVPSNRRLAPLQVAQSCAQMFRDLTDKRPALHYDDARGIRTGPFFRFVSHVFEALNIDASAEHYAKLATEPVDVIGGNGGVAMRNVRAKK